MVSRILLLFIAFTCSGFFIRPSAGWLPPPSADPPFLGVGKPWVDSIMSVLTPDQRIGQLFMVAAYSNKTKAHQDEILKLIKDQQIGGLIFMQGGPVRQAKLNNLYQQVSNVPLLISIDGEWGLSMRLDSTVSFPKQMTLGAIRNDSLIYRMGGEIARHCRRLGIHVNFAPVADVNNNPSNPVINMRSFGENKYNVAAKAIAYMKGLQDNRILANAKHFPGHGDTDTDSHKALPVIRHSRGRLDSLELYPFRRMIAEGLGSMMIAHLFVPALDSTQNIPTTLSKKVVSDLLKNELAFKGLIFTDALNMKGVSAANKPGFVDTKALLAGNDVLLFSENVSLAVTEIRKAIAAGEITQAEIDRRCRKILEVKYWCGLHKKQKVELRNLHADLNTKAAELLNRQLTEASFTVLENKNNLLPLKGLDTLRVAALAIGDEAGCLFHQTLRLYAPVKVFSVQKEELAGQQAALVQKLKPFNLVIVSVHNPRNTMSKSAGVTATVSNLVAALNRQGRVVLNVFANPYSLAALGEQALPDGLVVSYEDNDYTQELSAQLIFGGIRANGVLPVSVNKRWKHGQGMQLGEVIRLKYTIPEELGIQTAQLRKVDSIAELAIRKKATPGCQLLIAKDGKVFYNKTYGFHTYSTKRPVLTTDLYDIASITKIAASTLAIMQLTDEGFIELNKTLGDYILSMRNTAKGNIKLRDLLLHQAGLPAWIPFYKKTIETDALRRYYYRSEPSDSFPIQVAENMYLRSFYPDTMLRRIDLAELGKKEYKYSDLGYYLFRDIIEQRTRVRLDRYVDSLFYRPMGLHRLTYNPLDKYPAAEIVPTENDLVFRRQLIHGYVHDPGAAMTGGVAGHAGLFSNANSLAVIMQMLLNKGEYGGQRYISRATVEEFTRCHFCRNQNRRGLGFDKPEMNYSKTGPTCKCVSAASFGHTGFTGTIAWADPEKNITYIFLSNRVHPSADNTKLNDLSTRVAIQEAIYKIL